MQMTAQVAVGDAETIADGCDETARRGDASTDERN